MSDAEQVSQALAELWDIVKCRCHEAYTGRGLHDPDCQCDSTDAVQTVANAIEALTKERDQHWDSFVHWRKEADDRSEQLNAARQDAKEAEAYAEELEAKLAKAVEAVRWCRVWVENAANGDHPRPELAADDLRTLDAILKGESHD